MKKILYLHEFKTPFRRFRLASTEKGLAIINFTNPAEFKSTIRAHFGDYEVKTGGPINKKAEKQIKSYLDGRLKKFSLKLDLSGTSFQRKVLRKLSSIPYGKTITYGKVAAAIGNPGGARAVGSVNAKNLLPIVIPCHRVVASNGLGGYAGGLRLKKQLLNIEGA